MLAFNISHLSSMTSFYRGSSLLTATRHFISTQGGQTGDAFRWCKASRRPSAVTQHVSGVKSCHGKGSHWHHSALTSKLSSRWTELEFSQGQKGGLMAADPPTRQAPPNFKNWYRRHLTSLILNKFESKQQSSAGLCSAS